ncbi:LacI family DNA-binding transcriptional regulator [Amnibacterium endophyticum]|uniref:LacI family DNA-binding transcriptional regulator n=1 Tax=Amnibacterium endophyticum TaxID=2109337 RepID=A0ABW4LAJ3_9MICO
MSTGGRRSRPTVADVARAAEVAPSTVSNVLHDHPNVRPEKRARVLAAIDELGYVPSFASRQLRRGGLDAVALVVPDITSPYFAGLAHAFMAEARRRGITLLIDETDGRLDQERHAARGYPELGLSGVVFLPVAIDPAELDSHRSATPMVLLGEHVRSDRFDHVAIDSRRSAREATAHLLALGRSRLAFIGLGTGPGRLRELGFEDARVAAGLTPGAATVLHVRESSRDEGAEALRRLLPRIAEVDGIVCSSDLLAIGALRELHAAGVAVPDDVAVLGWDDTPDASWTTPTLTSVAYDMAGIASRSIDALERRRDAPLAEARQILVDHRVVPRASTVAPAG